MLLSLRIGRIFGIRISLHLGLVIYIAWVLARSLISGSAVSFAHQAMFLGALFFFVFLHELGHALMAKFYYARADSIVLHPFGGLATLSGDLDADQSVLVSLAGPAVNITFIMIALAMMMTGLAPKSGTAAFLWRSSLWANFMLAAFNLLPIYPLDGGRVVRSFVTQRLPHGRALRGTLKISMTLAGLLMIYSLVRSNIFALVISLFVLQVNWAEYSTVRQLVSPSKPARRSPKSDGLFRKLKDRRDRKWLKSQEKEISRIVRKTFEQGYESLTASEKRLIQRYHSIRERLSE